MLNFLLFLLLCSLSSRRVCLTLPLSEELLQLLSSLQVLGNLRPQALFSTITVLLVCRERERGIQ